MSMALQFSDLTNRSDIETTSIVTDALYCTGDITVDGLVDSVDIKAFKADYDSKIDQAVLTTSTPTFARLTLSNALNALTLGITNPLTITAAMSASRSYIIPDVGAGLATNFIMTAGAQTFTAVKTFQVNPIFTAGTAFSILGLSSGKAATSYSLTDGQLLIGSTGVAPVSASLTGTASQITVTSGAGAITLSLPQNIATSSTPSFASMTLSAAVNQLLLGSLTTITAPAPSGSRSF